MAMLVLATGCQEKDLFEPNPNGKEEKAMSLDFSTTQEVKFHIDYTTPEGYPAKYDVYVTNPLKMGADGKPTLKAGVEPVSNGIIASTKKSVTKTLPIYAQELYLYSNSLFVPQLMKATVVNGEARFEVESLDEFMSAAPAPETRAITKGNKIPDYYLLYEGGVGSITPQGADQPLEIPGAVGENHEPCIAFHTDLDPQIMVNIDASFPEKVKLDPASEYIKAAHIHLSEEAEVWISMLHVGATWDNSLGYFYHEGPVTDLTNANRANLNVKDIIAVPLAKLKGTSKSDANLVLTPGDYIQLKYLNEETGEWVNKFPAGTTIGWNLRPQAYSRTLKNLTKYWQWPLHSVNTLNTDNDRHDCVIFNAGTAEAPFYCIGFEDDYRRNSANGGDEDFNDLVMHVLTTPATAVENPIPTIPEAQDVVTVIDRKGIVAFEDYWPQKFDYDLNDVVVKYNSATTFTCKVGETETYLTRLEDEYYMMHSGAMYHNKFGVKIEIDPDYIKSISIDGKEYTPIVDNYDGKAGVIVDICPDVLVSVGKTYTVKVEFNDGVTEEMWEKIGAPYNPFITVKDGVEVHLPHFYPTERADLSLFGTADDMSDPENHLYYVSGETNKYPYAIHLAGTETFDIPTEGKAIDTSYPKYPGWVESNGEEYRDWYIK